MQNYNSCMHADETSPGCEYCKGNNGFVKRFGAFYITRNSEWYINTAHCKPQQINFCPMCGRELRGENNEEKT